MPLFRYRCGLDGQTISRPGWSMTLSPEQLGFVRLVDGRRTIRNILAEADASRSAADREQFARELFQSLINRDFLVAALTAKQ